MTYTVGESRKVLDPIPLCSIFEMNADNTRIRNYVAYMDVNPLFVANGFDVTEGSDGKPTWVARAGK